MNNSVQLKPVWTVLLRIKQTGINLATNILTPVTIDMKYISEYIQLDIE
jgi:hypothetical protein